MLVVVLVLVLMLIALYEIDCFPHDLHTTQRPKQGSRSACNLRMWPKILDNISACACYRHGENGKRARKDST
ncbi:hypothetical protein BKA70DRAFT_1324592 [Coprinopsis sp. MPI-PUGE-AT-0042]|nr:hypothetical protein BKA70DRAFT_1324592 [Coprinopsis sp. MPI-PUGE-AT-0042]